jgi:hypothetical protein
VAPSVISHILSFITVILNGLQDSGIENGKVYFSAYIDTESSAFSIRKIMVDLCNYANLYSDGDDAYQNGDEASSGDHAYDGDGNSNNQCQLEDGTYYFSTELSIPKIDSNWADTGWTETGQLIMYNDGGEQVGLCQASFRTLIEFTPSSKTVFLFLMPSVGVAFFILTYCVLRRVIRDNPDLCGDDLTYKSEGVTTTAYSVFSDSTSIASDFSSSMKCQGSKAIRNDPDWCVDDFSSSMKCQGSKPIRNHPDLCVDDLTYSNDGVTTSTSLILSDYAPKSEGVTTNTNSVFSDYAPKSEGVTTNTNSVFSDYAAIAPDSNSSMKCWGSKPISKERCEKGNTIGGVGDKRDKKVEEIKRFKFSVEDKTTEEGKRVEFGVEGKRSKEVEEIKKIRFSAGDKTTEESKRVKFGVENKRGKKVEEIKRVKVDPPDGIEEAMWRKRKKRLGKEAQSSKSPPHLVRMGVSAEEKVLRRPSMQGKCASDDVAQAYSRMEKGNIKSVVVSASSPTNETPGNPRMEMTKTKSAIVSTSSGADVTKVNQYMEGADTTSAFISAPSTAKEIKATDLVEEANNKSAVVAVSSAAHETKVKPLRKACTKAPVVSASSAVHESKAHETDTQLAADAFSSAAHETKDYQRMSKDNVMAVFTQNEQGVVTRKNKRSQRVSADLAAVGGDIAAMGGDMVSSFAAAFSELTTSQDKEYNDATLVRHSDRRPVSLSPSPKKGKRMIRDDNSSVHAVALGRQGLTRCDDMSFTNSISATATNSVATSVAVDWRKKIDKTESPV